MTRCLWRSSGVAARNEEPAGEVEELPPGGFMPLLFPLPLPPPPGSMGVASQVGGAGGCVPGSLRHPENTPCQYSKPSPVEACTLVSLPAPTTEEFPGKLACMPAPTTEEFPGSLRACLHRHLGSPPGKLARLPAPTTEEFPGSLHACLHRRLGSPPGKLKSSLGSVHACLRRQQNNPLPAFHMPVPQVASMLSPQRCCQLCSRTALMVKSQAARTDNKTIHCPPSTCQRLKSFRCCNSQDAANFCSRMALKLEFLRYRILLPHCPAAVPKNLPNTTAAATMPRQDHNYLHWPKLQLRPGKIGNRAPGPSDASPPPSLGVVAHLGTGAPQERGLAGGVAAASPVGGQG